jgi:hypothetical protein
MRRSEKQRSSGIILLVVLSMLTFFSLLVAAYLVFSSQSLQSSFSVSTRNIKAPNPNALLDEALMTYVRGINDPTHPFFGEDLLSDYYGRTDSLDLVTTQAGIVSGPAGAQLAELRATSAAAGDRNDVFAGRVITVLPGTAVEPSMANQSFRVIRSIARGSSVHGLIISLPIGASAGDVGTGASIHMNGVPRNSPGIGFVGGAISQDALAQPNPPSGTMGNIGLQSPALPASLQPSHIGRNVDKTTLLGDFDERYDAADFNNWFLSYQHETGGIIPSYHRPAVINYILNQQSDWTGFSTATPPDAAFQQAFASMARSTFRPLPIANQQLGNAFSLNTRFTGGNENFALRTPLLINNAARLDQLARVLIGSVDNPWDVDNDGDGFNDSIWMDIGLPIFTSPEGKLLKPLVAPKIEDLSGRLNINAHDNVAVSAWELFPEFVADMADNDGDGTTDNPEEQFRYGLGGLRSSAASWAGTRQAFGSSANRQGAYKGVGYGPAEIRFPATIFPITAGTPDGTVPQSQARTPILNFVQTERYRHSSLPPATAAPVPGVVGADEHDVLRSGRRPASHTAAGGYGYSTDPFGRGGVGIGRNGQLVTAVAGTAVSTTPLVNEAVNDPYESDPTGRLSGDAMLTHDELELLLRSSDFDRDLLTSRLQVIAEAYPELASLVTTTSVSDDSPGPVDFTTLGQSAFTWLDRAMGSGSLTVAQLEQLVAPEIRLGRKLDVNRPIGNGIDDNSNGTIDEPAEVTAEIEAFAATAGQTVPAGYTGQAPAYTFGDATVTGRQLLARHLYVLVMSVTQGVNFPVTPATTDAGAYRARRFAQWAVNVVDYCDSDSIMTRFGYDPNPFDGWAPSEVVWGVEAPELLLSEVAAFHDPRVKDTTFDNVEDEEKNPMPAPTNPDDADNDTDQVRVPQGSVFLELYCPRSPVDTTNGDQTTKLAVPQELYDNVVAGSPVLNLARLAPAPAAGGPGAPIWRLAFSEPHFDAGAGFAASGNQASDPAFVRTQRPETATFEASNLDSLNGGNLVLDRFVWFANFADIAEIQAVITNNNITDMPSGRVFFAPSAINTAGTSVAPGQYVSIAPRTVTHLGSHTPGGTVPDRPSHQRFSRTLGDGVVHFGADDVRRTPTLGAATAYTPALPLVVGTFRPAGWNANNLQDGIVGLNVSEPWINNYYPQPSLQYLGAPGAVEYPLFDAYVDLSTGGTTALDTPLDVDPALAYGRIPASTVPSPTSDPAGSGREPALGTIPQYCSVFLQRLADPLSAYDASTNPYITVDWMSVDLTVFSGEERRDRVVTAADYTRRTRQRNGHIDEMPLNALYSYETDFEAPSEAIDLTAADYFSFSNAPADGAIHSSLNFLNTQEPTANPGFNGFSASIGSEGAAASNVTGTERNLPRIPFAMHPWLNRPFATHYELLMVPACSPGRLMEEFSVSTAAPITNATAGSPVTITAPLHGFENGDWIRIDDVQGLTGISGTYTITFIDANTFTLDGSNGTGTYVANTGTASKIPDVYATLGNREQLFNWNAPFRHLLNFFHTPTVSADTVPVFRILDLVHTKPRFRGEVEILEPTRVASGDLATLFHAPFNMTYDNRRQGRINLNSINSPNVWRGLMQNHMNADEYKSSTGSGTATQLAYNTFIEARRGYQLTEVLNPVTNATGPFNYLPSSTRSLFPTEFAGVFRDPATASLMPPLRDTGATALLRAEPINGGFARDRRTFDRPAGSTGITGEASRFLVRDIHQGPNFNRWTQWPFLGASTGTNMHLDRNRNAFMRYQTLMRMPNLVSDNSQTYLVRLTMGFFEVSANNTDDLGAEYKEASGENQRYKAMFIIDRSIPVGFVPGQDLNARNTVVFERFYQ